MVNEWKNSGVKVIVVGNYSIVFLVNNSDVNWLCVKWNYIDKGCWVDYYDIVVVFECCYIVFYIQIVLCCKSGVIIVVSDFYGWRESGNMVFFFK